MADFGDVHILLVEDDEVDMKSVQREFDRVNSQVKIHLAKNGEEALAKLYGKDGQEKLNPLPSVIILDLNMPKMNGIEFLNNLRSDPEFFPIKVYLLVGVFSTKEKLAIKDLSVAGCIVKPLQHDDALNIFWAVINERT